MSDFLTDLIQRQDEITDAVRPRLPSLFESDGAAAPLPKASDTFSELTVREDAPVSDEPPRATRPLPQIAREKPAAPAQETGVIQPAFAPANERARPARRQPLQPLEQNISREPPGAAVEPRRAPEIETKPAEAFRPREEPAAAIQPVVERRVTRLSPVIEETEIVEAPRTAATRRIAGSLAPESAVPAIRPAPQPPVSYPPAATASPFAIPPQQTRQQKREVRHEQREQPHTQAEPSIQVTIGRIEIRASEDREPRGRKQDAPSPVMTLEDYLKSRAKR
jgi:hypothetical protein